MTLWSQLSSLTTGGRRKVGRAAVLATSAVATGALVYAYTRARRPTSPFPRATESDSTLALLTEGYTFISSRCLRYHTDIFETRLMGQSVFCMSGAEAAEVFYAPDRFTRARAMPTTAMMLLQDWRSVQLLDGEPHRHRKRMFMDMLMDPQRVEQLAALARHEWDRRLAAWPRQPLVRLHDEAQEILCAAVCAWAGVPLADRDVPQRARELGGMIDGAGSVGPRHVRGHLLRARTERWAREVIASIREGRSDADPQTAAHVIAAHRDEQGNLLDVTTAAVELINVLRPTVAVARFITFGALALHHYPHCRARVLASSRYLDAFVQEVRRFYPFFPAVGGRVRHEFEWKGYRFAEGTWVVLDLYGTNHDGRIWRDADAFLPERFIDWESHPFTLVPQGGGAHAGGHRCPGEDITAALMKIGIRSLANGAYDVPAQDLTVDLARMPALPRSGMVIRPRRLR